MRLYILRFLRQVRGEDGLLNIDYTVDGLCSFDEEYRIIIKEIIKIIEGEGIEKKTNTICSYTML